MIIFYDHQNIWRSFSVKKFLSGIWDCNISYLGFGDKEPFYSDIIDYRDRNQVDIGWTEKDLSEILIKEKLASNLKDGLKLVPELVSIKEEGIGGFIKLINVEDTKWAIRNYYNFD